MCQYGRLIRNKKYEPNKKNGGYVDYERMLRPDFDKRVLAVPIGCGNCMECRKQKKNEWQIRLLEDVRHNKNGKFITLTFSNESIKDLATEITQKETKTKIVEGHEINEHGELVPIYAGKRYVDKNGKLRIRYKYRKQTNEIVLKGYETDNAIAKLGLRKFLERWRKKYGKSLRHWIVTELGHQGTENVHMHGIVWTNEEVQAIAKEWKYGYIWIGEKNDNGTITNYVTEKTVNYITKYITKMDFDHKEYKAMILTSAGIGEGYFDRTDYRTNIYIKGKTKEWYTTRTGHKMMLPIYYRNKIYSDEQRELLWLEKLDKEERWVNGEKVSTKEGYEEYYKLLEWYRRENIRLGYGTSTIEWDRKQYEEERRILMQQERIKNKEKEPDWVNEKSEAGTWTERWLEEF